MKKLKWFWLLAGAVVLVLADQFTKMLPDTYLKNRAGIPLIEGVFELAYVENRGAAFGMLQNQRIFFLVLTVVALVALVYLYSKIPAEKKFYPLSVTVIFLIAGAVGNMIDRTLNGYVIDFLYFKLIDFPVFNVADIYVTVSCFVLIFLLLFFYKEEDLDRIFPSKKKRGQSVE